MCVCVCVCVCILFQISFNLLEGGPQSRRIPNRMRRVSANDLKVIGRLGHQKKMAELRMTISKETPHYWCMPSIPLESVDLEGGRLQHPPFIQFIFTAVWRICCVPDTVLVNKLSLTSRCSQWRQKTEAFYTVWYRCSWEVHLRSWLSDPCW